MITRIYYKSIFKTSLQHIAFAINCEGINDSGLAGKVAAIYTSRFSNTGIRKLGEVITVKAKGKSFHGLVCHSLSRTGWKNSPHAITKCLNKLSIGHEEVAIVVLGGGSVGKKTGANVEKNLNAIQRSRNLCIIYTLEYTKAAILKMLN